MFLSHIISILAGCYCIRPTMNNFVHLAFSKCFLRVGFTSIHIIISFSGEGVKSLCFLVNTSKLLPKDMELISVSKAVCMIPVWPSFRQHKVWMFWGRKAPYLFIYLSNSVEKNAVCFWLLMLFCEWNIFLIIFIRPVRSHYKTIAFYSTRAILRIILYQWNDAYAYYKEIYLETKLQPQFCCKTFRRTRIIQSIMEKSGQILRKKVKLFLMKPFRLQWKHL